MRGIAGMKYTRNCGELRAEIDSAFRRDGGAMTNAPRKNRGGMRVVPHNPRALNVIEYIGVKMMSGYSGRRRLLALSPSGVTASTSRLGLAGLLVSRSSTASSSAMIS